MLAVFLCLTWIVSVMGGRRPYSWCLVGCCRQDLFNIARNILVQLPSSFFSRRLVNVQVVHPYSSIDTTAAWKKLRFTLSVRSDIHMIDRLSIAIHALVNRVSMSFSVDETLLLELGEIVYQFQRGSAEPDMQDTAGKARTSSLVMYSY